MFRQTVVPEVVGMTWMRRKKTVIPLMGDFLWTTKMADSIYSRMSILNALKGVAAVRMTMNLKLAILITSHGPSRTKCIRLGSGSFVLSSGRVQQQLHRSRTLKLLEDQSLPDTGKHRPENVFPSPNFCNIRNCCSRSSGAKSLFRQ